MHHMVVRVKDFDQSVSTWRDSFGLNLDRVDQNEALGIKQAFFNLENGGFIEIVSPTDDDSSMLPTPSSPTLLLLHAELAEAIVVLG